MNRITIDTLKEMETTFGSFDIDQAASPDKHIYLRFGYWKKVSIDKLQSMLSPFNLVTENDLDDDDCGTLYSYKITAK